MGPVPATVYEDEGAQDSRGHQDQPRAARNWRSLQTSASSYQGIPSSTTGRIEFDPRRISIVSLRFEGFIESVGKFAEGDYVRKGQTLMRVYGPNLSSAAAEYVAVLNMRRGGGIDAQRVWRRPSDGSSISASTKAPLP
ncbi:MAG: efflux RND transporter periplasmic adaptor subunit [Methylocystis sp.]